MNKTALFKKLVHAPELLLMPVAFDGISLLAIEQAGFKATCVAGYGTSSSVLGLPDIGIISSSEMLSHYANLIARTKLPVMVDIDTGFGDVNNVIRTVQQVEQMGAAALFIEDQTYPKRCGHMGGKSVVDVEEYLPKLKAALWARKNPDFMIMARTDARAVYGIDEAIRRAKIYAEAGADMIFVEAVASVDEMRRVNAEVPVPSMANMIEGGKTPFLNKDELQDVGYAVAAYPCGPLYAAARAVQKWATTLKEHGTTESFASTESMMDFAEYNRFIGAEEIREREKLFHTPDSD
ncbi:isocitrate lyase/PEP mutase family protein [Maridesulfovibrio sp.]|uniref:isocitrate lyase/PEP mutase family protein n=1 Tax=unclassified Maridesulfovibrio TaxID=2794999 RepID=UPI003B004BA6